MILSPHFSRQNRNLQTWHHHHHNNHSHNHHHHRPHHQQDSHFGSLKRAPPVQPAPKPPTSTGAPPSGPQAFRSQTLNRFELQQRRRANNLAQPANTANNNNHLLLNGSGGSRAQRDQIYAPASIASPAELAHYKRPSLPSASKANGLSNGQPIETSQHYAATSFRGSEPPRSVHNESSRSGRESALGNLLERFGSLRRYTKWSKLTSRRSASTVPTGHYAATGNRNRAGSPVSYAQTDLDEIYAQTNGSYGAGGSLGDKKRPEAEEIYAEGSRAIDSNGQKRLIEHQLNESIMSEGETRLLIDDTSKRQPDYQLLVSQLINWINDELAQQRIIVRDLQEDLYDGQILGKLIEKLHQLKLDIVEVTQNEMTQRYKLKMVLDTINRILSLQARWARIRWTVEGIHAKNMVEIIQLLVTLSLHYRAPIQLPADVRVRVIVVQKTQGQLVRRYQEAQLTCKHEAELSASVVRSHQFATGGSQVNGLQVSCPQRDAFDNLCEFAPEKLVVVKQSLVNFVNRHLNKINMSCFANRVQDVLDPEQFSDGLLLVFLMASLEDYFVPLGNLFTSQPASTSRLSPNSPLFGDLNNNNNNNNCNNLTSIAGMQTALEPTSYTNTQPIHKLHNVNVAIQLMEEAGIVIRDRVRAEDIVNGDLKSVLRVLYALFSRYKHL